MLSSFGLVRSTSTHTLTRSSLYKFVVAISTLKGFPIGFTISNSALTKYRNRWILLIVIQMGTRGDSIFGQNKGDHLKILILQPFIERWFSSQRLAKSYLNASLVQKSDIHDVIFEGDCLNVIHQLQQPTCSLGMVGGIIEETKFLANCFYSFTFCFVRRTRNNLAHCLAKLDLGDSFRLSLLPCLNPDVTWSGDLGLLSSVKVSPH